MRNRKKISWCFKLAVALVCLGGAGVGVSAFYQLQRTQKHEAELQARSVKAEVRNLKKELFLTGKVAPASAIAVYAPVSGQLQRIFVKEGEAVKAGQILFAVRQDTTGQRELESVANEVQQARVELSEAERLVQRRKSVRDLFAESDNERLSSDLEKKRLRYQDALQRLSLLRERLGLSAEEGGVAKQPLPKAKASLVYGRASRDGLVTLISKVEGESVFGTSDTAEAAGREVLILSDTQKMMVRSRVLEGDLAQVKEGMPVKITLDAFRDRSYEGVISRISQQGLEDKNGGATYFMTDVAITDPDANVRGQMNAALELITAEKKQALTVPVTAMATLNNHAVVQKRGKREASHHPFVAVKLGLVTAEYAEILAGDVKEGDELLTIDFAELDLKALANGQLAAGEVAENSRKP